MATDRPDLGWRVVKVGGSLFDLPELSQRLGVWLGQRPALPTALIAGGGAFVDAVRAADRTHKLDPAPSHWLSIKAMSLGASLLSTLLPDSERVDDPVGLRDVQHSHRLAVLDVLRFMQQQEPNLPGLRLPACWGVTSDSIAARVAHFLRARELVLLKSTLPVAGDDVRHAAHRGYVDKFFPDAAAGLPMVRCVNFRDPNFAEQSFFVSPSDPTGSHQAVTLAERRPG